MAASVSWSLSVSLLIKYVLVVVVSPHGRTQADLRHISQPRLPALLGYHLKGLQHHAAAPHLNQPLPLGSVLMGHYGPIYLQIPRVDGSFFSHVSVPCY